MGAVKVITRLSYVLFAGLLLIITPKSVSADHSSSHKRTSLVLGVVQFPPLIIRDLKNYHCYGSTVDHATALLKELGYQVHVECMPAARLFAMVEAGKVDVTINISTTGALANKVSIVYPPYTHLSIVLVNHANQKDEKTIAGIRSYDYTGIRQELISQGYTFVDVPSSLDAINLFLHNRTSNLVSYLRPYEYYLDTRVPDDSVNIRFVKRDIPTYFAISRTSAWHDELLEKFNEYSNNHNVREFRDRFN